VSVYSYDAVGELFYRTGDTDSQHASLRMLHSPAVAGSGWNTSFGFDDQSWLVNRSYDYVCSDTGLSLPSISGDVDGAQWIWPYGCENSSVLVSGQKAWFRLKMHIPVVFVFATLFPADNSQDVSIGLSYLYLNFTEHMELGDCVVLLENDSDDEREEISSK